MDLNNRVRIIRKNLKLNQESFGKGIGISNTAVSKIEKGENNLTEQNILSICSQYNVNEEWLRTGEGEMFRTLTPDQELADFVGELFSDDCEPKKKEFFRAMAKLPDEFFVQMMKAFEEVQEEKEKRMD